MCNPNLSNNGLNGLMCKGNGNHNGGGCSESGGYEGLVAIVAIELGTL